MIPKIIHYCWLSKDPLPRRFQLFLDEWKMKLPQYEFVLWDFKQFDINSSNWVKQAFQAKKYAFAADYIRLYALYTYGGIYLALDVQLIKTFDDLLDEQFILGYESDKAAIEAGIMGAEKNALWVKDCLQYYKGKDFINKDGTFNTTPLPYILYSIIAERHNSYLAQIKSPDYFTAKSLLTRELCVTSNTYTIHHFAGSWTPRYSRLKKKLKECLGGHLTQTMINLKNRFLKMANRFLI